MTAYPIPGRIIDFYWQEGKRHYDGPCMILETANETAVSNFFFVCVVPNGETLKVPLDKVRILVSPEWKQSMGETVLAATGDKTP